MKPESTRHFPPTINAPLTGTEAALFLNGPLGEQHAVAQWLKRSPKHYSVAVDGGLRHVNSLGLKIDLFVGDQDSADSDAIKSLEEQNVPIRTFSPDKDMSDFELALREPVVADSGALYIVGGLGGRFDHSLFNLHSIAYTRPDALSLFFDGSMCLAVLPSGILWEFNCEASQTFSLLPLSQAVTAVTTSGAVWGLKGADLKLGSALTLSNRVRSSRLSIEYTSGSLAVAFPHQA